jgi:hypothetical protein
MRLTLDTKNGEAIDTPLPTWLADLVGPRVKVARPGGCGASKFITTAN